MFFFFHFSPLQTRQLVGEVGEGWLGKGLVTQRLSEEQWSTLERINQSLTQEYATRRQMLLTRCDVTIQSFGWSERIKVDHTHKTTPHKQETTPPFPTQAIGEDKISKVYQERREVLNVAAPIGMASVLAAREDLLTIRKTNDPSVRSHTQCFVNKVLIGRVRVQV